MLPVSAAVTRRTRTTCPTHRSGPMGGLPGTLALAALPLALPVALAALPLPAGLAAATPAPGPAPAPATAPAAAPASAPAAAPEGLPAATPAAPPRQLVLDRSRRMLRVLEGQKELRRYPVAVGMPGWETPVGEFKVIEMESNPVWKHPAKGTLVPPGPANPLGSRWIGFHRDCRGRSGFNGQEHLVVRGCVSAGFHGTPNRGSIGQAVSHGCVRLFDEHARELFDLVSLGTPVTVLP